MARRLGEQVRIEWKSFLLRVEPKTGDRDRFVEYTRSWLRPAALEPEARFRVWATDAEQPSSSIPAQVAAKVVAEVFPQSAMAYHRRLLGAYFTENRNIADSDELVALGEEVGIGAESFRAAARDRSAELTQRVIDEHNLAIENGVTAVPTVVLEGRFPVPGAQDVETYERLIRRIAESRSAPPA